MESIRTYLPGRVWVVNKKDGTETFICYYGPEWMNVFMVKIDKSHNTYQFFSGIKPENREAIQIEISNIDSHADDYDLKFNEKIDIDIKDLL